MNIIALIPARGGSKEIPRKNVRNYAGIPLIAHSILIAKKSKYIKDVIVSTDDEEIKSIALKYGATVPFLRPSEYAQDDSTDSQVMFHYLEWLKQNNKLIPQLIVHLRPTYPNREIHVLDNVIETFIESIKDYDSLRTIIPSPYSPYKTYWIRDGVLEPLFKTSSTGQKEPYNLGRQYLERAFVHNGCIDIIKTSCMIEKNSITGDKIFPYPP